MVTLKYYIKCRCICANNKQQKSKSLGKFGYWRL